MLDVKPDLIKKQAQKFSHDIHFFNCFSRVLSTGLGLH